jgi:hypothetical protein
MVPGADLDRTGLAGWQAAVTFYPATGKGLSFGGRPRKEA